MKTKKILIADDDESIIHLIKDIFSSNSFSVLSTNDGASVIPLIKKEKPSLIILDIMLPHMDGFTLCKELNKIEEAKDIPVLVISAHKTRQLILNLYSIGVKNYLQKPFNIDELKQRVEEILKLHQN